MSSAANDKRGKLEEEFQNRMYDAEASPSQDLWARIDHDLTVQENGAYKRSAAFYRQLAAACITLLLLAGGVGAWYFNGAAMVEEPLATVAPATKSGPAATLPAPSEEVGMESAVAATAEAPEQAETAVPAPVASTAVSAEQAPASRAAIAAASGTTASAMEGAAAETALSLPDAGSGVVTEAVTGTLAVAGTKTPETAETEGPLGLNRSLRQTITALSALEAKPDKNAALLQQSLTATGAALKATDDFKKLNEQVMAQAKRMEEEQKALLLAFNEETTDKKESGKEKESSRWSLGMAYAPGYFEQNIDLAAQPTAALEASSRFSLTSDNTSSISSLYMDEARDEYTENADPGFSFGFEVKTGLKLGKKLKLLTGLGFLQNTSRSRSSYIVQPFRGTTFAAGSASEGPSTIFVPSISSDLAANSMLVAKTPEYEVKHRYRYLTVPVELQYEGGIGKDWFWYGGAGAAANILMQTTIMASASEVQDVEYDLGEESPFRRLQWSGKVSGGVGKRLAGNMSVTVGPEFRSYLSTLLAEPENTQASQGRPYALGLNMAVNYELNSGKKSR